MKIGITGASSTGKTTLAKVLSKELNLPYVESPVRAVQKKYGITDYRQIDPAIGLSAQLDIINTMIKQEKECSEGFISDRLPSCAYVYYLMHHAYKYSSQVNLDYYDLAVKHMRSGYDIVFYIPAGDIPIIPDDIRVNDPVYQKEYDFHLKTFCFAYLRLGQNSQCVQITGSIDQRLQAMRYFINKLIDKQL